MLIHDCTDHKKRHYYKVHANAQDGFGGIRNCRRRDVVSSEKSGFTNAIIGSDINIRVLRFAVSAKQYMENISNQK
ncbi:hypothetical protein GCK72_025168 [Caenorhabditis remanei]|uniref:Uncharacterized protein n=1 Tax=Caenorhabditis remanei TaxID=31234 RepID=A0A6A5G1R2_CAERE|nr:hypothetical protein GCK72_025168 [Caenorhabditis remanei]KAF1748701.1 hypothetical protein GCK72_025168 [Caenorhabditis remanei]